MANTYITYAFPLLPAIRGEISGGLHTVFASAFREREQHPQEHELIALSLDAKDELVPQAQARVISMLHGDIAFPALYDVWFNEWWAAIHPEAHTAPKTSAAALAAMFQGDYASAAGSVERIAEHFDKYSLLINQPDIEKQFSKRFVAELQQVPAASTIFWHDYFFVDAILTVGAELKEKHCTQVLYLHTSIPEQLTKTAKGRELLRAVSLVDTVHVHTDTYVSRLREQLEELELPVPKITRFDLGVDADEVVRLATRPISEILESEQFSSLPHEQQTLLKDALTTRDTVPHRFVDIGRLDPIKGSETIIDCFTFLFNKLNPEEVARSYRLYLVWPYKNSKPESAYNLHDNYRVHVRKKAEALAHRYPQSVLICDELPREYIPALLAGACGITGGTQDGLNLAIQESICANAAVQSSAPAIAGDGIGFAMRCKELGLDSLGYFPEAGNAAAFVEAVRQITELQHSNPPLLRDNNLALDAYIRTRNLRVDEV